MALAALAMVAASVSAAPSAGAAPTPFKVLILGDSYSSGNGTDAYYGLRGCYRSHEAWGEVFAADLENQTGRPVTVTNRACGGAVFSNLRRKQVVLRSNQGSAGLASITTEQQALDYCKRSVFNQPENAIDGGSVEVNPKSQWTQFPAGINIPAYFTFQCREVVGAQLDQVSTDYDLVLLTFGGNDGGFGGIGTNCLGAIGSVAASCNDALSRAWTFVTTPLQGSPVPANATGPDREGSSLADRANYYLGQIDGRLNAAGRTKPPGQILYLQYPYLIRNSTFTLGSVAVGQRLKQIQDVADNVQRQQVGFRRRSYVSPCPYSSPVFGDQVKSLMAGHEAVAPIGTSSGGWWLNGFDLPFPANVLHPNASGTQAMADAAMISAIPGGTQNVVNCTRDPLVSVTATSNGGQSACALVAGTPRCWGLNVNGELGLPRASGAADRYYLPQKIEPSAVTYRSIDAGRLFSCGVTTASTLRCWGRVNGLAPVNDGITPTDIVGLSGVQSVAVGDYDACAVLTGGTVSCFGLLTVDPTLVPGLSVVSKLAEDGSPHDCALLTNGTVKCWGYRTYGQLGDTVGGAATATPVTVAGISGATDISSSRDTTCVIVAGGAVKCWGRLDGTSSATPITVPGIANAVDIAMYLGNTGFLPTRVMVRTSTGQHLLWNGDRAVAATTFTGFEGASTLSGSGNNMCGVVGTNAKCFGDNAAGQLGAGYWGGPEAVPRLVLS